MEDGLNHQQENTGGDNASLDNLLDIVTSENSETAAVVDDPNKKSNNENAENKPATPAANAAPAATQIAQKPEEIFGEKYKGYDWDKFRTEYDGTSKTAAEVGILRGELETAKQLSEQAVNPFADEDIASYNEFVKETNVKNYGLFERVKTADASKDPVESLVTEFLLDNPSYLGKEELVRKKMLKDHQIIEKPEMSVEEQETLELNKIGISQAAKKADERLATIREKLKVVTPVKPEVKLQQTQQAITEKTAKYEPIIKAEIAKYQKIKIPIEGKDKDGKVETFLEFELSGESLDKYSKEFSESFAKGDVDIEKNPNTILSTYFNRAVMENFPKIVHAIAEKARSMSEEEYLLAYSNPSAKLEGVHKEAAVISDGYSEILS